MENLKYSVILALLLPAVCMTSASAKMYKWIDEKGVPHFSDTPPARENQSYETLETPTSSSKPGRVRTGGEGEKRAAPEAPPSEEERVYVSESDVLGTWKHLGVSKTLSSEKISKPYKPQSWEFRSDGYVVYTIGNQSNRFPYRMEGNTIITTPFKNQKKSFVVVKYDSDRMVWKDPNWKTYIHVERSF
jgi:hypothetical protein